MVPGMIGVAVSVLLVFGKFLSADSTISTGNSIYRIMDMPKFHQQACARYGSVMSAVKELPGLPTFGTQEAKWNEAENTCIIHTTDGTKEDFTAIGHDTLKRVFVFDMKKANKKNNQERLKNAFGK